MFYNLIARFIWVLLIQLACLEQAMAELIISHCEVNSPDKVRECYEKIKIENYWHNLYTLFFIAFFILIGFIMIYFIRKSTKPNRQNSQKKTK